MRDYADLTRRLADLVVGFGANVQPGQIVGDHDLHRQGGAHPRGRARRLRARRALGRRPLVRPVGQARAARCTPTSRRSTTCRRGWSTGSSGSPTSMPRAITLNGPADPEALDGRRSRARRPRPAAVPPEHRRRRQPRARRTGASPPRRRPAGRELVYPDARRRARRTTASGRRSRTSAGSTSPTPPRRGASARGPLESVAARLTERRFDAIRLHGPGTDLTVGLFRSSAWHAADFDDGRRAAPLPEHPERGDVHDARPAARRRPRDGDAAARGVRRRSSTASGVEFEGGRAVTDRRGHAARTRCARSRRRTTARRASASSRSSTARAASARSARSSSRRCSTRTPPATSRSATATSSASSRRPRTRRGSTRARSTSTS